MDEEKPQHCHRTTSNDSTRYLRHRVITQVDPKTMKKKSSFEGKKRNVFILILVDRLFQNFTPKHSVARLVNYRGLLIILGKPVSGSEPH